MEGDQNGQKTQSRATEKQEQSRGWCLGHTHSCRQDEMGYINVSNICKEFKRANRESGSDSPRGELGGHLSI